MQNRTVLTVSKRRVRGDCYRFGLTVSRHHVKTGFVVIIPADI